MTLKIERLLRNKWEHVYAQADRDDYLHSIQTSCSAPLKLIGFVQIFGHCAFEALVGPWTSIASAASANQISHEAEKRG